MRSPPGLVHDEVHLRAFAPLAAPGDANRRLPDGRSRLAVLRQLPEVSRMQPIGHKGCRARKGAPCQQRCSSRRLPTGLLMHTGISTKPSRSRTRVRARQRWRAIGRPCCSLHNSPTRTSTWQGSYRTRATCRGPETLEGLPAHPARTGEVNKTACLRQGAALHGCRGREAGAPWITSRGAVWSPAVSAAA